VQAARHVTEVRLLHVHVMNSQKRCQQYIRQSEAATCSTVCCLLLACHWPGQAVNPCGSKSSSPCSPVAELCAVYHCSDNTAALLVFLHCVWSCDAWRVAAVLSTGLAAQTALLFCRLALHARGSTCPVTAPIAPADTQPPAFLLVRGKVTE
jgi:hypothetical protein